MLMRYVMYKCVSVLSGVAFFYGVLQFHTQKLCVLLSVCSLPFVCAVGILVFLFYHPLFFFSGD